MDCAGLWEGYGLVLFTTVNGFFFRIENCGAMLMSQLFRVPYSSRCSLAYPPLNPQNLYSP